MSFSTLTKSIALCLAVASLSAAEDAAEIPADLRGTWSLRLTSSDGGKTYLSGGNMPICEVTAAEIKLLRKVDWADEKLTVKEVKTTEADGRSTHHVTFTNGKVWRITTNSGSITSIMHDSADEKSPEKYRIVTRILR